MPDPYYHPFKKRLTTAQMQTNAIFIRDYLTDRGWTLNAIAAVLGNWQSECTLNPNLPSISSFPRKQTGSIGLPQWDPWYKKYGRWCEAQGIGMNATNDNPSGRIEPQIEFHDYNCKYGHNGKRDWYNNHGYSYTWTQFKTSTDHPQTLAEAYYWQYERSAAGSVGTRGTQAVAWYNYLSGQPYSPSSQGNFKNATFGVSSLVGTLRMMFIWLIILILRGGKNE